LEEEKKIYIGNLDYDVTESDLKGFLEEKGMAATEVKIITDKYSGRSKGFGFAEFATEKDAQKAIDELDGKELNGRSLKVNRARRMKPQRDRY